MVAAPQPLRLKSGADVIAHRLLSVTAGDVDALSDPDKEALIAFLKTF